MSKRIHSQRKRKVPCFRTSTKQSDVSRSLRASTNLDSLATYTKRSARPKRSDHEHPPMETLLNKTTQRVTSSSTRPTRKNKLYLPKLKTNSITVVKDRHLRQQCISRPKRWQNNVKLNCSANWWPTHSPYPYPRSKSVRSSQMSEASLSISTS